MGFAYKVQKKKKKKIAKWVNERLLANLSCIIPLIELTVYHTRRVDTYIATVVEGRIEHNAR